MANIAGALFANFIEIKRDVYWRINCGKTCSLMLVNMHMVCYHAARKSGIVLKWFESFLHSKWYNRQFLAQYKEYHMSDVLSRVTKMVVEHLDVEEDKVTDKANFIDDLGADSLDNVELVMAFEEEFDIEIPDDAAETIQTVGDAVKFISAAVA